MPVKEPPATVTVRRSWAVGGLLAVVVVIVAMSIALAAVAGDDGPGTAGGFPQGPPSGVPEMSQGGMAPPQTSP
jgi:hypothetical protein